MFCPLSLLLLDFFSQPIKHSTLTVDHDQYWRTGLANVDRWPQLQIQRQWCQAK